MFAKRTVDTACCQLQHMQLHRVQQRSDWHTASVTASVCLCDSSDAFPPRTVHHQPIPLSLFPLSYPLVIISITIRVRISRKYFLPQNHGKCVESEILKSEISSFSNSYYISHYHSHFIQLSTLQLDHQLEETRYLLEMNFKNCLK